MRLAWVTGAAVVLISCGGSGSSMRDLTTSTAASTAEQAVASDTSMDSTPGSISLDTAGDDLFTGEIDEPARTAAITSMRQDPSVVAAVGSDFDVVEVYPLLEGIGSARRLIGASFLIHTWTPVVLPAGTMSTAGHPEGEPSSLAPIPAAVGPFSDLYVNPVPAPGSGFFFLWKPAEQAAGRLGSSDQRSTMSARAF